jgi:hypothetical protein
VHGVNDVKKRHIAHVLNISFSICFSFSSRIVRCPWHQSWLAAVLIQNMKLFSSDRNIVTVSEVEIMKKEAEFQCILYSLPHIESCSNILEVCAP